MDASPTPTTSPRRRRFRFASAVVVLIGLFSAACIVWFAVQRLAPWSDFNLFGFVLAPWLLLGLLIGLIVVLILSARTRRFTGVIPVVMALALLSSPYVAARLPWSTPPVVNGTPLRVMSFNVWLSTAGTNLDQIAQVIHEENPDLVALQEMSADSARPLQEKLNALQPHQPAYGYLVIDRWTEQTILSRYPIQIIGVERRQSRVLMARVALPSGPVQVWSVHAYRTNVLPGRNFLSYRNLNLHREPQAQFGWLAAQVKSVSATSMPLVLMGDFNLPYETTPMQSLSLSEAHVQAGRPFDFTFPASSQQQRYINVLGRSIPLSLSFRVVRIDHILVNARWQVQQARTLADAAGSDHAPISADLVLLQ